MFYHDTCPQSNEEYSEDSQFAEWMDLLTEDEEASKGYAVPADDEMETAW